MARGRSQKASATSKTGVPVKRRPALKSAPPVKGTASTKSAGARPIGDGRVPVQKAASVTNLMVTLDELKAILLAKRAELVSKLREEREGRRDGVQREKIEGTPFGDRPGLSPDDEMGFAVADRRAGMLAQIDLALKKMDEGSYGRCEACEEPINRLRLRVHPFAVRCTRCQEAWERDQSRVDTAPVRGRSLPEETS
jgi:DnaK suppressor protein